MPVIQVHIVGSNPYRLETRAIGTLENALLEQCVNKTKTTAPKLESELLTAGPGALPALKALVERGLLERTRASNGKVAYVSMVDRLISFDDIGVQMRRSPPPPARRRSTYLW